jgi:DnaJ-class molecular chaperone
MGIPTEFKITFGVDVLCYRCKGRGTVAVSVTRSNPLHPDHGQRLAAGVGPERVTVDKTCGVCTGRGLLPARQADRLRL